jgi:hypothetical protein
VSEDLPDEDLSPSKGMLIAIVLAIPLWLLIFAILWWFR